MHDDDKTWISSIISKIKVPSLREKALNSYIEVFEQSYFEEKIERKKMNKARFNANSRLRKFYEKYIELYES